MREAKTLVNEIVLQKKHETSRTIFIFIHALQINKHNNVYTLKLHLDGKSIKYTGKFTGLFGIV